MHRSNQEIGALARQRQVWPGWVPENVHNYIAHVSGGQALRAVARETGGHASTVLRQVHRLEQRRDDPLVDEGLQALETAPRCASGENDKGREQMIHQKFTRKIATDAEVAREARRILRRLCENTAFLLVAKGMEKAAIMRETSAGKPVRIAITERHFAQAFALRDWIENTRRGKIAIYRITAAGRSALKRLLAEDPSLHPEGAFAEGPTPFQEQHKEWGTRAIPAGNGQKPRRMRCNLAESPVTALGRRKGPDGAPFLNADLVAAAERLREDFEMAQMGPRVAQNWDRFLTTGRNGGTPARTEMAAGPMAARARIAEALSDLGPGLGDIALRCCCYLEGLEAAEKRMGWSARSGKVVLRIALQRLKMHYESRQGTLSPLIG